MIFFSLLGFPKHLIESFPRKHSRKASMDFRTVRFERRRINNEKRNARRGHVYIRNARSVHGASGGRKFGEGTRRKIISRTL